MVFNLIMEWPPHACLSKPNTSFFAGGIPSLKYWCRKHQNGMFHMHIWIKVPGYSHGHMLNMLLLTINCFDTWTVSISMHICFFEVPKCRKQRIINIYFCTSMNVSILTLYWSRLAMMQFKVLFLVGGWVKWLFVVFCLFVCWGLSM